MQEPRTLQTGSGSPEGLVTAVAGTCFLDATAGVLYHKAKGMSTTGWVAISFGGGASPIQTATVTLTDAQIKTLPTAGITLLNLSAGQQPVLLSLFYQLKTAGGAYSNVDAGAIFLVQNEDGVTLANDSSGVNLPLTTAAESRGGIYPVAWGDVSNPATQQIQLWLNNNIAGQQNLTGGNAANTLIVTVLYIIVTRQ